LYSHPQNALVIGLYYLEIEIYHLETYYHHLVMVYPYSQNAKQVCQS
jgi:hypothetical protein